MHSFDFEAIGTFWRIEISQPCTDTVLSKLQAEISLLCGTFDKSYSRFREDSFVAKIAKTPGTYLLPDDAGSLFAIYQKLYVCTKGLFTPLIGDVLIDAGYDDVYSLQSKPLRTALSWDKTIHLTNNTITLKQKTMLDLGGVGKGYLIDLIGALLIKHDIYSFCIDGSGDLLYKNNEHQPLRIGLENPNNTNQAIGIAEIQNGSLCGSSGNRRAWGKYHHIINPKTNTSPKAILSTWVHASTGIMADALATCLFLVPPKQLMNDFDFAYAILHEDFTIEASQQFPGEFFS